LNFANLEQPISAKEAREPKEYLHTHVRTNDYCKDDLLEEVDDLPGIYSLSEHQEFSRQAEGT